MSKKGSKQIQARSNKKCRHLKHYRYFIMHRKTDRKGLTILLEWNMICWHPMLSIAVTQDKGQEEDQTKMDLSRTYKSETQLN
jgi:hypothetical protein